MPRKKKVAEPITALKESVVDHQERDKLAGYALMGLCATRAQHKIDMISGMSAELAATAYIIADDMITLRKYSTKELKEFIKNRSQSKEN